MLLLYIYFPMTTFLVSLSFSSFLHISEMYRNIFFCFFLAFAIFTKECMNLPSLSSTRGTNDEVEISEKNETEVFQELMDENTTNSVENDSLFWTINPQVEEVVSETEKDFEVNNEQPTASDVLEDATNDTTGTVLLDTETPPKEEDSLEVSSNLETVPDLSNEMNEKIVLPRRNCNLELAVDESQDTKIQIKFEPLQNNTAGKCYVNIIGRENSMLGILITNVHLYRNNSEGEFLQVIVTNSGMNFVLKEYDGLTDYHPLLLTETHKVYIVLRYNVTTVTLNDTSHFNLEVFSYHKYENHVDNERYHGDSSSHSYSTPPVKQNVENIFFTTQQPSFFYLDFF